MDHCEYAAVENGHPVLYTLALDHEAGYGIVAVDRSTQKTYWFYWNNKPADVFKRFVEDEHLWLNKKSPLLFFSLYSVLVLGANDAGEVTSLWQLRRLAEDNFLSAYSPYEQDEKWEPKFVAWWKRFRSGLPNLRLETTWEPTSEGVVVHGFSFEGFELTIPRSDPPPKGVPTLRRWSLLLKTDGAVESLQSSVVYASK